MSLDQGVCPECGQVGDGPFCHHWDAGEGERKVPTVGLTVRWFECAHGHQFAVVVEKMPAAYEKKCPGCGTITLHEINPPHDPKRRRV